LEQPVQLHETPHIPAILPRDRDIAHLPAAQFGGGLRRQTCAAILGLLQQAMRFDFLRQFAIQLRAAPSKEEAPPYVRVSSRRLSMEVWRVSFPVSSAATTEKLVHFLAGGNRRLRSRPASPKSPRQRWQSQHAGQSSEAV
jgi:hypothetical protein